MKKKLILVIVFMALVMLPCLFGQANADREVARTQEFIDATMKKGTAKIDALKAYVKKFPEASSRWTRLAYYHMAVEYFQTKNYAKTVEISNKTLKMGSLGDGEQGRLYLIIANSYGVKSASIFNQAKALELAEKAVKFAQSKNLKDVLSQAKKLKKQLCGPPPKKMTPEQEIKMLYSDEDFKAAISFYKKLSAADKANLEIHKTYANALLKDKKLDSALKEFQALYSKDKKAVYALRIADIYNRKAKRNKALNDSAVNFYLESSVLYGKEGNASNQKIAYKRAEFQLFEKYAFNKKIKQLEAKQRKNQASAAQNASKIRKVKLQLRKLKRKIRKEYEMQELDPPVYMKDNVKKLENQITALESGVSPQATDDFAKLEEEKKRIQNELKTLLANAKKKLG